MQSSQHQIKLMRFSEDHSVGNTLDLESLDRQRQMLRHSHLEVSSLITPKLEDVLASVLERCAVARDKVACFVKNDQTINASCRLTSDGACVLVVSSGTFNSLAEDEVKFVLGHELGHYIFGHVGFTEGSEENLWLSRAAEISSDRVGMLAAGSASSALRTIVKILSGLDGDFIRFDVTKLLGGLDSSASVRRLHKSSTHPSLLVRARALLHWDMVSRFDQEEISAVNRRISNDMYKFIDKTSRTKLADLQLDVCIWKLMTLMFGEHYSLDAMKKIVASQFDGQVVESVSELLQEGVEYAGSESERRLQLSIEYVEKEFPKLSRVTIDQAFSRAYEILSL